MTIPNQKKEVEENAILEYKEKFSWNILRYVRKKELSRTTIMNKRTKKTNDIVRKLNNWYKRKEIQY